MPHLNPPSDREVVVTIGDSADVALAAKSLSAAGFEVESILEMIGTVTGRWSGTLDELRQIPGVASAEDSGWMSAQQPPRSEGDIDAFDSL
ncbi:MAG: hypothetical protein O2820_10520 [Planctomycetota bacterium]|nr:hypothetical protein [Planctomycetota bacterium]MDA1249643.1 hypothetical protein [Planctomycetota bacterium]